MFQKLISDYENIMYFKYVLDVDLTKKGHFMMCDKIMNFGDPS